MIGTDRPRRHRRLRPACDRLESRELLSGSLELVSPAAASGSVVLAREAARRQHKFHGPIITRLPVAPNASFSTVPASGDVNPYGVAVIPNGFRGGSTLSPGDVLVSNFNSSSNLQGTGSTIVKITPSGAQSVFYQGPSGAGLTTALGVLKRGFVIVGSLPTQYDSKGNVLSVGQGSLIILDSSGHQVGSLSNPSLLNGPWDLTVNEQGTHAQIYVSNVLSGTVTRIVLKVPSHGSRVVVQSMTQIASGYIHRTDPVALVIGPTGLAYNAATDTLYVASTGDNAIFAIHKASRSRADRGKGNLVYQDPAHLRGPLGLALAPNGDLLTTNGDVINPDSSQPSEVIEFTPTGTFIGQLSISSGQGGAFGLATSASGNVVILWNVNDVNNTLEERTASF